MLVEYNELTTPEHFKECVILQKKIFNLADIDVIPEMFLSMIARKDPIMGLLVGAFMNSGSNKTLIGFSISIATNENNSIYAVATGVLPEFQNNLYGYRIILKVRDLAIKNNIKTIYSLYDPLESNLGRLYMQKFGYKGIRFKENAYELNTTLKPGSEIPNDKILIKSDLLCEETCKKIEGRFEQIALNKALELFPVISENNFAHNDAVLVEIPNDFILIKKNNFDKAIEWRKFIRNIFSEYINNRKYIISDCLTSRIDKKRKSYYLLEKL
jgi:predicted GNAT superfamily acetyltransferase